MEFRTLGDSGLKVSLAGLGCNNFGMTIDYAESEKVIRTALDAGITFFDNSDIYGDGQSETFLGRALGSDRHDAVILTKFGLPTGQGPYASGGSRRYAIQACEASLARLGTDYIDVYLLHVPDDETPLSETIDAMKTLVDQGKVRYVGLSNHAAWQLADAAWEAESLGLSGFVASQNEWSLLSRDVEREVVPACDRFGLGITPYFPLASGALTGKYKRGQTFDGDSRYGRAEGGEIFHSMYGHFVSDETLEKVERLARVADDAGISLVELALSWLASQPVVSSVIAGATKPEQVEANARLTHGDLGDDVIAAAEKAVA